MNHYCWFYNKKEPTITYVYETRTTARVQLYYLKTKWRKNICYDKNVLIDFMCDLYSENGLEENVKENKVKAKVEEFKRLYGYTV